MPCVRALFRAMECIARFCEVHEHETGETGDERQSRLSKARIFLFPRILVPFKKALKDEKIRKADTLRISRRKRRTSGSQEKSPIHKMSTYNIHSDACLHYGCTIPRVNTRSLKFITQLRGHKHRLKSAHLDFSQNQGCLLFWFSLSACPF